MSSIIWIVRERPDHSYEAARSFGTLCSVFPQGISPFDIGRQTKIIREDVLPVATEGDLILLAGPQIMVTNLVVLWLSKFEKVRFLVWNHSRQVYEVRWQTRS